MFVNSCNSDDAIIGERPENESLNDDVLCVLDENNKTVQLDIEGRQVTINLITPGTIKTRAGEQMGPYQVVPTRVSTGQWTLITNLTESNALINLYQTVAVRLGVFQFTIQTPADASQFSVNVYPTTAEGFTTQNGSSIGFSVIQYSITANGVIIVGRFYTYQGAMYNMLGQQMSPDTEYPVTGTSVRYNYTYVTK